MDYNIANLIYLGAATTLIFGLRDLSHPKTAVRGNILAAIGMLIAIVVTLVNQRIVEYEVILAGVIVGALGGSFVALRVHMTKIPQLVALFNGFGGGASALVAGAALEQTLIHAGRTTTQIAIAAGLSGFIGSLTLLGSLIAFLKLHSIISERPIMLPARHFLAGLMLIACIGLVSWFTIDPSSTLAFWILIGIASLFGILLVIPIGGADMPVVISLLNSYSGLATAATGFVLDSNILIIVGSFVGAAGIILTTLMSKAMNRSLPSLLFGGLGSKPPTKSENDDTYANGVTSTSAEEVAILLTIAKQVVIVPGFGMAISQAQYAIRDLLNLLESRGVKVFFAIHPVAGRMPGHMNVLLAESDIPYQQLIEMDKANTMFDETDVGIVVGANDTVNPLARGADESIPIAGMPIINVDQSKTVVVIKRSLSPGFAGLPNPLFAADNTLMLYGDAKEMIQGLITAIKNA